MGSNNVDRVRRWVQPLGTTFEEVQAAVEKFCEPDVDYYPIPNRARDGLAAELYRPCAPYIRQLV